MKRSLIRLSSLTLALTFVFVYAGSLFAAPPPGSPVARHGHLRTEGNRIVNEQGEPVQLRGMSLFWSLGATPRSFYSEPTIGHLANDWNADVVRAAMSVNMDWGAAQRSYLGESPETGAAETPTWGANAGGIPDPTNKDHVINVIDAAILHGIYVIVDWHAYFGNTRFPNPPPLDKTIEFFLELSDMYPNVPNIIWEILNEPIGNSSTSPGVNNWWNDTLKPWKQTVTNAIRNNGDDRIIIIGTPRWCQRPDVAAANPVDGKNLVYSMHFYAGSIISATNRNVNQDHNETGRQRIITTMMLHQKPVFISEWGLTHSDGGQPVGNPPGPRLDTIDVPMTNIWMDFLEQYNIGYANWNLNRDRQGSAAIMNTTGSGDGSNPSAWILSPSGTYMREELRRTEPRTPRFYSIDVRIQGGGTLILGGNLGPYEIAANHSAVLDAVPNQGETFVGWTVDGEFRNNLNSITLSGPGRSDDRVVIAEFTGTASSIIPASVRPNAAQWSVRKVERGIRIAGPQGSAADVVFYDIRGKAVRKFTAVSGTTTINSARIPAGNYLMVVRDRVTGRDVHKSKISLVN